MKVFNSIATVICAILIIFPMVMILITQPRIDHSKDKFCTTLPAQCVEPVHKTEGATK